MQHFRGFKENYFKIPANNSNISFNRIKPRQIAATQVKSFEITWNQVKSSETKWNQVKSNETNSNQAKPSEINWNQLKSTESIVGPNRAQLNQLKQLNKLISIKISWFNWFNWFQLISVDSIIGPSFGPALSFSSVLRPIKESPWVRWGVAKALARKYPTHPTNPLFSHRPWANVKKGGVQMGPKTGPKLGPRTGPKQLACVDYASIQINSNWFKLIANQF